MNAIFNTRKAALTLAAFAPMLFQAGLEASPTSNPPVASAVPLLASNPTSPHTSWSGNPVTLKGTLTSSAWGTDTFTYDWNPGDGGSHCTGTVTNQWVIACAHTYTGSVGAVFTAVLTITDTTTSLVSPPSNCPPSITQGACYYTTLDSPPPNLPIEVNNAIDNGLWYLHSFMRHFTTSRGAAAGDWAGVGGNVDTNNAGGTGPNALNCSAFQNSGFLQTNSPANPYSNDVALCLVGIFDHLTTMSISEVNDAISGSYNPDGNGNGIAVTYDNAQSNINYQIGMPLDATVTAAAANPLTPIPSGTELAAAIASANISGSGAGGAYTYKDAIQDMVDYYVDCQAPDTGGWHYSCKQTTGDNSISQWAAIGIIPARRASGSVVPAALLSSDQKWLQTSFTNNAPSKGYDGYFGYTSSSPLWGPYAVTPAGLVQLAMNGLGRGTTSPNGDHLWDAAETYLRDNFGNSPTEGGNAANDAEDSIKAYYYGMFSFTKSMILHDNSGTGLSDTPITYLQSTDDPDTCAAPGVPVTSPGSGSGPCYPNIDWYAAQTSTYGGTDPTNGVARTIIGNQLSNGSWSGQNYTSSQNPFQTAISITMLNKTVFQPVPVACFTVTPSNLASGGTVTLNGGCSVEQNPANSLTEWQWDISGTGAGYTIGPGNAYCKNSTCSVMAAPFTLPANGSLPYTYPIGLKVTDSGSLSATVTGSVVISSPPNPPNAVAGGPYNFCPNISPVTEQPVYTPFLLNGSQSSDPDQGKTDGTPNAPPSTLVAYNWDYACAGNYSSASGAQVNATSAFDIPADYGTSFNICLQVVSNDLCSTAAGQTSNPPLCAFPTGAVGTLSSVSSAQVSIHNPTDEVCTHCVQTVSASAKAPTPTIAASIDVYWTDTNTSTQFSIDHYNVYRSSNSNFTPYIQVAGAASNPFSPAVRVSNPAGGTLVFVDNNVSGGQTYYYRIAPATTSDTETCQSNLTLSVAISRGR